MESAAKTDQAAAEWLAKRDSNTWSEADQRAFDAWVAASTVNQVAYLRIERGWEEALRLKPSVPAIDRTDRLRQDSGISPPFLTPGRAPEVPAPPP